MLGSQHPSPMTCFLPKRVVNLPSHSDLLLFGDRKGATKKLCDKHFAERSGELSGAICLKTLVLLGNDP